MHQPDRTFCFSGERFPEHADDLRRLLLPDGWLAHGILRAGQGVHHHICYCITDRRFITARSWHTHNILLQGCHTIPCSHQMASTRHRYICLMINTNPSLVGKLLKRKFLLFQAPFDKKVIYFWSDVSQRIMSVKTWFSCLIL